MIFRHVARAAQKCRALCYANILPNLTNQNLSFHIFVRHEKSVKTMLDYLDYKGRKWTRLKIVKEKNPNFFVHMEEMLRKCTRGAQEVFGFAEKILKTF